MHHSETFASEEQETFGNSSPAAPVAVVLTVS